MCFGLAEGECVRRWCASHNFSEERTRLVAEWIDCVDDLKLATPAEIDEMVAAWKPLAQAAFRRQVAALREAAAPAPAARPPAPAAASPPHCPFSSFF